jgi:O-antigen/teichoic acid export membrane protein
VSDPSHTLTDLGHRVAKGALWMVAMRFAIRGIGLASTIIIARLLKPEDFGLVALASAMVGAVEVFGAWNFDVALVREADARRDHYNTVWTLSITRGALIALMLVGLAAPAASFFGDQRIASIVYAYALGTLIEGFQNVGVVDFRKNLNFHQDFIFQVLGRVAMFVATVTLAILWRNYWALVFGVVVGRLVALALSYAMNRFRPQLSLKEWRGLFGFSKWLLFNNILTFFSSKLDTFAVGRIAGTHALGLYEIGYEIANLPTGELVFPIQRALLPGYAKLAGRPVELAQSYLGGLSVILLLAVPTAVGIALVAKPIVDVFLGARWAEVVPLLQILAIPATLRLGVANAGAVLLALGRAKLITLLDGIGTPLILAPCIVIGTLAGGASGAAWGLALSYLIRMTITVAVMLRIFSIPVSRFVGAIWRTLAATGVMGAAVAFLSLWWEGAGLTAEFAKLLALSLSGAAIYVGVALIFWRLSGCPEGPESDALGFVSQYFGRRFLVPRNP